MQTLYSKVKLNKVCGDSDMSLSMAPDILSLCMMRATKAKTTLVGHISTCSLLKGSMATKRADGIKREPIWLDLQREDLNYNRRPHLPTEEESGTTGQGKVISHGKILILLKSSMRIILWRTKNLLMEIIPGQL